MSVTVVVPAHNAERYIVEAISSALDQSHPPLEVIVVDDGSTDRTAALAACAGKDVRCVSQERAGAGAARNRGVSLARGAYVAFLDADDVWMRDKLERQLAAYAEGAVVFGMLREFVSPELPTAQATQLHAREGLHSGYCASAMLAPRSAFELVGSFSTELRAGEVIDWIARARDAGLELRLMGDHVVSRRVHGENMTLRERGALRDFPRVVKAALDRRRAGAA